MKIKRTSIFIAIVINIAITISEAVIGFLIGSLALISDAVHNFSDVGALGLSWWGEKVKEKDNTKFKTYGYKRAEILIAFFNSLVFKKYCACSNCVSLESGLILSARSI